MTADELNQPLTKKYLGEYTEEVLLPAMSVMMDEKLQNLVTKEYLDEKLGDL